MPKEDHTQLLKMIPTRKSAIEIDQLELCGMEVRSKHDNLTLKSPLWMVTKEHLLNDLVMQLQNLRKDLEKISEIQREISFSRNRLEQARTGFAKMIKHGEEKLHQLCKLICESLISPYHMQSVVIGEVDSTKERFTLSQDISTMDLFSNTDIDLGNRQIGNIQFFDGKGWSPAYLIANVVEYQPTKSNTFQIHRIISRIKAEEEIWNKVVDEIFQLDSLVKRDKKLCHLSRFVKDIFGIKIVVSEPEDVQRVQNILYELSWSEEFREKYEINLPGTMSNRLEFIEIKDYLSNGGEKKSGWGAIKSVVQWSNKTFEIQIQPLRNYLRERELLTKESHTSFKARREQVRNEVSRKYPLFRFYQDLLRWLFLNPDNTPPVYEKISLRISD
jgi:hypothetical protein